jgi:hypothetical protein
MGVDVSQQDVDILSGAMMRMNVSTSIVALAFIFLMLSLTTLGILQIFVMLLDPNWSFVTK